jgi:hypothetical protein
MHKVSIYAFIYTCTFFAFIYTCTFIFIIYIYVYIYIHTYAHAHTHTQTYKRVTLSSRQVKHAIIFFCYYFFSPKLSTCFFSPKEFFVSQYNSIKALLRRY